MEKILKIILTCVVALSIVISSISVFNTTVKANEKEVLVNETEGTEVYNKSTVVEEL